MNFWEAILVSKRYRGHLPGADCILAKQAAAKVLRIWRSYERAQELEKALEDTGALHAALAAGSVAAAKVIRRQDEGFSVSRMILDGAIRDLEVWREEARNLLPEATELIKKKLGDHNA